MTDAPLDLVELAGGPMLTPAQRKRLQKVTKKNGYAAPPGGGPRGETCGSCEYLFRNRLQKTYLKCELMRAHWTGGAGTDVKARAPACREWKRPDPGRPVPPHGSGP